jgi:valyl-tRNA synthetase
MLENNLKVLHPFMPFLTEEIWQIVVASVVLGIDCFNVARIKIFDANLISDFGTAEVISGIRTIQQEYPFKDAIELKVINNDSASTYFDRL